MLIDGTNSNTASLVSSYAGEIIAAYSADVMAGQQRVRVLTRSPGAAVSASVPQIAARTRVWFNPDLYSRNYFIPGVIANIIMMVTLMLTALAIVREKEIGTMEQLMVTPVRPIELMLGKTLPFALVGLLDVVLVTGVALLLFHIPLHGSFAARHSAHAVAAALYLDDDARRGPLPLDDLTHAAAGDDGEAFSSRLPPSCWRWLRFPDSGICRSRLQYLTYLNPVRYFIEIVRGIFLKGSGIDVLWPQMACLAVYGVAVLGLSAARFHKSLD